MRFAYTQENGTVAIVIAAPKEALERVLGPLTDAEYRKHVIERSIPKGVAFSELPKDWQPPEADRTFRNAWKRSGSTVHVDMPKARDIHMGRIRHARNRKLDELDREWMKHASRPAEAAAVEGRRQALRDLPATFDLSRAATPEELKALWPPELT